MTLKKLIEHYVKLTKKNYETVCISQVINDLRQVRSIGNTAHAGEIKEGMMDLVKKYGKVCGTCSAMFTDKWMLLENNPGQAGKGEE